MVQDGMLFVCLQVATGCTVAHFSVAERSSCAGFHHRPTVQRHQDGATGAPCPHHNAGQHRQDHANSDTLGDGAAWRH